MPEEPVNAWEEIRALRKSIHDLRNDAQKLIAVEERIKSIEKDISKITRLIEGNGRDGIPTRLSNSETRIELIEDGLKESKDSRQKIALAVAGQFLGLVMTILGGLTLFFMTRK